MQTILLHLLTSLGMSGAIPPFLCALMAYVRKTVPLPIYCVMPNYVEVCTFLIRNWRYVNCYSSVQWPWRNILSKCYNFVASLRVMLQLLPPPPFLCFCSSPASLPSALWWILPELIDLRCFLLWHHDQHKYVLASENISKYIFCLYGFNGIAHFSVSLLPTPSLSRCRMRLIWGTIVFPVFNIWVWEWKGIPRNSGEVAETEGPHFEWFLSS